MSSQRIVFVDLVVLPGGPHPIPFRTRSLSPSGPMVLRLKARESRSPPGLPSRYATSSKPFPLQSPHSGIAAGWSSPVARQAHNLKVTGSNPVPAPKLRTAPRALAPGPFSIPDRLGPDQADAEAPGRFAAPHTSSRVLGAPVARKASIAARSSFTRAREGEEPACVPPRWLALGRERRCAGAGGGL
jgi:hypothetical protein